MEAYVSFRSTGSQVETTYDCAGPHGIRGLHGAWFTRKLYSCVEYYTLDHYINTVFPRSDAALE